MINPETVSLENFESLFADTAKLREDITRQEEALADIVVLRDFANENKMVDRAVESFFEQALVEQHVYMDSQKESDLNKMAETIESAKKYVLENKLSEWESRVARYLGRVADYRKDYQLAIKYYQEAIDKVFNDSNYVSNSAMAFEYRGFMVIDKVRLLDVEEGIDEARKLYDDYMFTEEGNELRQKDYTTWAIWRSAIFINLSRALIDLGFVDKYKEEILKWLENAERNLRAPEGVSVWADFAFRKNEIAKIRELLV